MLRKNILVIISKEFQNEEFQNWIKNIFNSQNLEFFIFSESNREVIDGKLIVADQILNFLENEKDFEFIQNKIESLKINYFGNSKKNIQLFSKKINFKKIIEKTKFKTPIFEKIDNKTTVELFNSFIQPSRIFSKKNNYFSGKISSLIELENILSDKNDLENYFIEEYIDGDEILVFVFKRDEDFKIFIVKKNGDSYLKVGEKLEVEISEKIKEFFDYSEIEQFGFFDLIYSQKRGLYFLNIFLENKIIFDKRNIINEILNLNHQEFKDVFED